MSLRALKLKNQVVDGVEIAPAACIICGEPAPRDKERSVPGWQYFANAQPAGAIACSEKCAKKVIDRFQRTGRVDTPAMRAVQ